MDARLTPQTIVSRFRKALGLGFAYLVLHTILQAGAQAAQPLSETIQVRSFPTHSRMIFRIDDTVPVQWKETRDGFEALFKGLNFTDVGAPLGEEEAWAQQFRGQLIDPRLASVDLREVPGGLKIIGKWKYPTGPQAPADPRMETFNYREHKSAAGEFIVDFWLKKGMTVAEAQVLRKKQAAEAKEHRLRAETEKRIARRLASDHAKAELDNLEKFCAEPLSESKDVFLTFLPVDEQTDYEKGLPHGAPDQNFTYYEPKEKSAEADYVRLALKLYREEKYGLANRTIDFLDTEHPQSHYREEMKFLRANALYKLGMKVDAEKLLVDLKNEAKGKPVALYSALFLAAKQVEMTEGKEVRFKDPLTAYETFSWLFTWYPEHPQAWLFHLGAAEALATIKQTEQAAKEYLWVAENAKTPEQRAQGALRLGNVYLSRREYPQALEAYGRGLRYFKKQADGFPAIHLNRGETLYGLGEFEEARKVFEAFVDKYTGYPHGWRATLRLGEIYGRLSGKANEEKSRKFFYDTINYYPLSAGSTLARLRLLPCGDHGGFTYEAAARFFDGEARKFDASSELSMVRYPDLRGLAQARSYIALKHEQEAIDVVQREMVATKTATMKSEYARLYEQLFRKNIVNLLREGKDYDALNFYSERSRYREKGEQGAVDPEYLIQLSLAASELGLGKKAEMLAQEYRSANQSGRVIAAEKPKAPVAADLDAKLRSSEEAFADARALWISGGDAEKIRSKMDQVAPESPYSFEKEVILGLLEEKHEKLKTAREHALKAQVLMPDDDAETRARVLGWLASLESKVGDSKSSLAMYRELEKKAREKGVEKELKNDIVGLPDALTLEQILLAEGNLLDTMKRWGETAAVYSKAVDLGLGGNQAMYGYARALLKAGDRAGREKATITLQKLSESKTEDFWKKLAQETLANLQLNK